MPTKTNSPLPARVEEGKSYSWCSCGNSRTMPLCDGSHELHEGHQPFEFIADATKIMYLCGCATTGNPPYCDGSHCKNL